MRAAKTESPPSRVFAVSISLMHVLYVTRFSYMDVLKYLSDHCRLLYLPHVLESPFRYAIAQPC